MRLRTLRPANVGKTVVGMVGLVLVGQSAFAQTSGVNTPGAGTPATPTSTPPAPVRPTRPQAVRDRSETPQIAQSPQNNQGPQAAQTPQAPLPIGPSGSTEMPGNTVPPGGPGQPNFNDPRAFATQPGNNYGFESPFLAAGIGGAGEGGSTPVAASSMYIDSAIIRSRVRLRFDAGFDINTPDKAEFFYAKCGCFAKVVHPGQPGFDPHARGPVAARNFHGLQADPKINYRELATYLEYAATGNFSAFVEVPARFLRATVIGNAAGFSDINAGFKYAFVAEPDRYYTFQLRTYAPTGASDKGLGTGHVSLEPGLLIFQRLTDRLYFNGEIRDWIPVAGSNFAGNVIRYGAGLTYNLVLTDHFRVAPMNEVVGWSILGGKELDTPVGGSQVPVNVGGQTIVNEKIGIQFGLGDYTKNGGGSNLNDHHTLGVSYGHAITGDHWYKDIVRVEYNCWF